MQYKYRYCTPQITAHRVKSGKFVKFKIRVLCYSSLYGVNMDLYDFDNDDYVKSTANNLGYSFIETF